MADVVLEVAPRADPRAEAWFMLRAVAAADDAGIEGTLDPRPAPPRSAGGLADMMGWRAAKGLLDEVSEVFVWQFHVCFVNFSELFA